MIYHLTMDKKDIMFFCAILESTERYGFVRTIDPVKPVIELNVSPYYVNEMDELLRLIRKNINFEILKVIHDE